MDEFSLVDVFWSHSGDGGDRAYVGNTMDHPGWRTDEYAVTFELARAAPDREIRLCFREDPACDAVEIEFLDGPRWVVMSRPVGDDARHRLVDSISEMPTKKSARNGGDKSCRPRCS